MAWLPSQQQLWRWAMLAPVAYFPEFLVAQCHLQGLRSQLVYSSWVSTGVFSIQHMCLRWHMNSKWALSWRWLFPVKISLSCQCWKSHLLIVRSILHNPEQAARKTRWYFHSSITTGIYGERSDRMEKPWIVTAAKGRCPSMPCLLLFL